MYNPDYPTDNTLGFAQHTYQPQQSALNYWDGGMGMGTYMNPYNNMDSRRNMGMAPVSESREPIQSVWSFTESAECYS